MLWRKPWSTDAMVTGVNIKRWQGSGDYNHAVRLKTWSKTSVVVLESPCPRGYPWTNLQVLVLFLVLGPKSPGKLSRASHSANHLLCMITWSINSVTATLHEVTAKKWKNSLLISYITYWYRSVSKPFCTETQCCCTQEKPLSSRTNLQVLVLVPMSLSSNLKFLTTTLSKTRVWLYSDITRLVLRDWSVMFTAYISLSSRHHRHHYQSCWPQRRTTRRR